MIEDEALSLLKCGFKQWLTVKLSSPWRAIQLPNPSGQDDVLWTAVRCSEAPPPSLRRPLAARAANTCQFTVTPPCHEPN